MGQSLIIPLTFPDFEDAIWSMNLKSKKHSWLKN